MDVAQLRYEIDSSQTVSAKDNLGKMSKAARDAENAQKGLGSGSTRAAREVMAANDNMVRSTGLVGRSFTGMRVAALSAFVGLAGGILGASVLLKNFVSASIDAQKGQAQLAAALKSTGGASGQTLASLNAHAAALQSMTAYEDDAINGAQGLLLTFTKIKGDIFPQATLAILNLSQAMGGDLKSAALQVGKALNDPLAGMTALSRSGIQFTQAQKDSVKAMVELGNVAGAQRLILKELDTQFGGSAAAMRGTLGGAIAALGNAWGNLFEMSGPASEKLRMAIESLIVTISSPEFVNAAVTIGTGLFNAMTVAAQAVQFLADNFGVLTTIMEAIIAVAVTTYVFSMIAAFVELTAGLSATAIAATGLEVAMAFLSGPLGLAIAAVAGAMLILRDNTSAAEQAAGVADAAFYSNKAALDAAKNSSLGYTMALRNQIAMSYEAAKAADIAANAEFDSAVSRRSAFRSMTGGYDFAPLTVAVDTADRNANITGSAMAKLGMQLDQVDAGMKKTAISTTTAGAANSNTPKSVPTPKENPYTKLLEDGQKFIAAQELESRALGMTAEAANKLRYEQDLLNKAQQAGVNLTPKMKAELSDLAAHMASAEAQAAKLKESFDFAFSTAKGFATDFFKSLEGGASVWDALKTAALNALGKISDKLLDMALNGALNSILGNLFGGSSGGGGGIISTLFGGGGGGDPWGGMRAAGGPVAANTNYLVGENGPEIFTSKRSGSIIPNHAVMPINSGATANTNQSQPTVNHFHIDARGAVEGTAEQIKSALEVYNREVAPRTAIDTVQRYQKAGAMR